MRIRVVIFIALLVLAFGMGPHSGPRNGDLSPLQALGLAGLVFLAAFAATEPLVPPSPPGPRRARQRTRSS